MSFAQLKLRCYHRLRSQFKELMFHDRCILHSPDSLSHAYLGTRMCLLSAH